MSPGELSAAAQQLSFRTRWVVHSVDPERRMVTFYAPLAKEYLAIAGCGEPGWRKEALYALTRTHEQALADQRDQAELEQRGYIDRKAGAL